MTRQERLADGMLCAVIWICVLFFAFAAGVWYDEHKAEPERQQPRPVRVTVHEAQVPEGPTPDDGGFAEPDAMIEDTFLSDDIPLDYDLQAKLYGACKEFDVDYELALAMLEQETQFKNIKGDGGNAYGYFQVWPKWHGDRMAELGVADLMDPEGNFRVAMHFIRECIDKYGLERGLGFYNGGEAVATRYSRQVLEKMEKYNG